MWESSTVALRSPITEAQMNVCFADYSAFSLVQKGADAASFADQDFMGFGYRTTTGTWVEFIVGSGTLDPAALDTTAPTVVLSGPKNAVTGDFTVSFEFSETVTGFAPEDIVVVNGTKGAFAGSGASYTLLITPEVGKTVSISVAADKAADAAGNGNLLSNVLDVQAGSPASAFDERKADIKAVLVDDAIRGLRSTVSANQNLVRNARLRFADQAQPSAVCGQTPGICGSGLASCNVVPFDVDGSAQASGGAISTQGEFFQQVGNLEGTYCRLFFGDFSVQRDSDTGSSTATLTARVAWERMVSANTLLGRFVGGDIAHSNINGSFTGTQSRFGLTAGGYAVHALGANVFADGFVSFGVGKNNLEMADNVLALESDYFTRTATIGGALTGVYALGRSEFRPELAFSYGKTWLGDVDFKGTAYGLTDDTLRLDAGTVAIANLTLRPEVVFGLDGDSVSESNSYISFAPRLICERTITSAAVQHCGGGAELGFASASKDSFSSANVKIIMDRIGDRTRSSVVLNVEHRF